jgi:putative addiction module CopG family antidote
MSMSTMRIPADVEASIQRSLERGRYEDEVEVMRAALRLLESREERAERLRASIEAGFSAIERGEGIELTPEFWTQLDREADAMAERGEAPSPDVCR